MAEITKIAWTDHTFNPWRGCEHARDPDGNVHPACVPCYAEAMSKRNPKLLGTWGGESEGGKRVKGPDAYWQQPFKWNREARAAGERRRVFCLSLGDVFEDWKGPIFDIKGNVLRRDPAQPIDSHHPLDRPYPLPEGQLIHPQFPNTTMDDLRRSLFELIDATPHLDWLLLTKRPENVRRMWPEVYGAGSCSPAYVSFGEVIGPDYTPEYRRSNVWLGTSISDQHTADVWVTRLLECRDLCQLLFLSIEPLLSPIDLLRIEKQVGTAKGGVPALPFIGWVIIGNDKHERKHRRTDRHPESVAMVANADFSAVPPLTEAMGLEIRCERCGNLTAGTREGNTEYCTSCGGVLRPASTPAFPPTCVHTERGLCEACQREYDEDPQAWIEYGQHPEGIVKWEQLKREMAEDAEVARG